MGRYELVCMDMFQTLVDIGIRIPFIWKRILKDKYNEEIASECAKLVDLKVINEFHERIVCKQEFANLKSIFEPRNTYYFIFSEVKNAVYRFYKHQ